MENIVEILLYKKTLIFINSFAIIEMYKKYNYLQKGL